MPNTVPSYPSISIPCFTVAGPLQIWGNTGASAATELLGWTRNGIEIQEQAYISELKSDLNGGEQGAPGDFQYLGEQHMIIAELAQFSTTVMAKFERRFKANVTSRTIGALMACAVGQFKVLFLAANFARLYTNVFINEPISYAPIGTPASFPRLTFTGLQDLNNTDGSPWNSAWSSTSSGVTFT